MEISLKKVLTWRLISPLQVSDTMRKGILDVSLYEGHEKELMIGALSSLAGSGIWLLLATALRLPISGTHSIVGATVGFSLVCRGTAGVSSTTTRCDCVSVAHKSSNLILSRIDVVGKMDSSR